MTRFHLVRHATHGLLSKILVGRTPGISLSEQGREEAARLAARLARERIDAVVSSPIDRARETAEVIAAACSLPVEIAPEIAEIDFGDWTGLAYAEIAASPEWKRFNTVRSTATIPGGEAVIAVQARMVGWLSATAAARPDQTVVAVSHGDPIKSLLCSLLGIPLDMMLRFEVSPASVSTVDIGADWVKVVRINEPVAPSSA